MNMKINEEMRDKKHGFIMDSLTVSRETVRKVDNSHDEALKSFSKETEDKNTALQNDLSELRAKMVKFNETLDVQEEVQAKSLEKLSQNIRNETSMSVSKTEKMMQKTPLLEAKLAMLNKHIDAVHKMTTNNQADAN